MTKEKFIVRQIKDYIASIGGYAIKYPGGPYSERGVSDLLCCIRHPLDGYGLFVAIEVKVPLRGIVSPAQKRWIAMAKSYGAVAFVARSVSDVERELSLAGFLPVDERGKLS